VILFVLENERSDRAGRREIGEMSKPQRFAMGARWIAEPIHLHAQLRQRLFEHPGITRCAREQHGSIRHAAGERLARRHFIARDPPGVAKIRDELIVALDVELFAHASDAPLPNWSSFWSRMKMSSSMPATILVHHEVNRPSKMIAVWIMPKIITPRNVP